VNFDSLEGERDNKEKVLLRENNAMYMTCNSRNAMILRYIYRSY